MLATLFNIMLIGLVLLIAYWWANQGLFSALLHLICVIVAGTIALAVWEPVTINLLLSGGVFDNYAWGVSLMSVFVISLIILRVIADKVAPNNVSMPPSADLSVGFVLGLGSGILTIGLSIIALGFVQSSHEIMGMKGYGRIANQNAVVGRLDPALWAPIDQWTNAFFSTLSVSTMYPTIDRAPLGEFNPKVHEQAWLVRDTFDNGKGQLAMQPGDSSVISAGIGTQPRGRNALVKVTLGPGARDFGSQLTLSSSQVRLIGWPDESGHVKVLHPSAWVQDATTPSGHARYQFDDASHFATSVPGRSQSEMIFDFASIPEGFVPRFIQIRNIRYGLPELEEDRYAMVLANLIGGGGGRAEVPTDGTPIEQAFELKNTIRRFTKSKNKMPSTMKLTDGYMAEGYYRGSRNDGSVSRGLRVKGIFQPEGVRIIRLNVSRDSPASLYSAMAQSAPTNAAIRLVDDQGVTFAPIGYILEETKDIEIQLSPGQPIRTMNQLPQLPTSGTKSLYLIFEVTRDSTIRGLTLGNMVIGTCTIEVKR
jgi:hypothetical protein